MASRVLAVLAACGSAASHMKEMLHAAVRDPALLQLLQAHLSFGKNILPHFLHWS